MVHISLQNPHKKFHRDSIRFEDDKFLIQTGGVFTSVDTEKENSLAQHIIREYESKGELFARDLRGSFRVYIYDKTRDIHLVYTNQVGDKRIFYYSELDSIIISHSVKEIISRLKSHQSSFSLDREAVYFMLNYGYLFGAQTLVREIRRLKPGEYLKIEKQQLSVHPYFELQNNPDPGLSLRDCIEEVDVRFRQAVSKEFEKDRRYGYQSLCNLSGGLDSRMTTWVGHDLGYTNMTNFTFGQSGSPDITIAQAIATKLDHPQIVRLLDGGEFMTHLDEISRITEGSTSYLPMSHGKYANDQVDFSAFGLLHTGQLGDVTLGSYCKSKDYGTPDFKRALSGKLLDKLPSQALEGYENMELLLYKNRGLNYILTGNLMVQDYSEATSPFLDLDFLEFSMSIPLEFRANHRLYKDWVISKYPGAAAFKWEKLGRTIHAKTLLIRGKEMHWSELPGFIVKGTRFHLDRILNIHRGENMGMNPFQYWFDTNKPVHDYLEQYFRENIDIIEDKEIRQDCEYLYSGGSIQEKAMVLTLLSAVKLLWES